MDKRVEELYNIIKDANEELSIIRKDCKHENKFIGKYEWWDHFITDSEICNDCGVGLKSLIVIPGVVETSKE